MHIKEIANLNKHFIRPTRLRILASLYYMPGRFCNPIRMMKNIGMTLHNRKEIELYMKQMCNDGILGLYQKKKGGRRNYYFAWTGAALEWLFKAIEYWTSICPEIQLDIRRAREIREQPRYKVMKAKGIPK